MGRKSGEERIYQPAQRTSDVRIRRKVWRRVEELGTVQQRSAQWPADISYTKVDRGTWGMRVSASGVCNE